MVVVRRAPEDDGARPGGRRALPRRGRRGHAALQDARRVGEGQLGAVRAAALRGRVSDEERALLLRSGVAFCPSIDYLERAWQDAVPRRAVGGAVPRGRGPDDDRLDADRRRLDRRDDVHPVRPVRRGGLAGGRARARTRSAASTSLARGAPNVKDAVVHHEVLAPPDLERIFGLRRRLDLPGRAGARPDGVHAPDAGARAVRDAGRRPVPVRRGHAPGRRRDGARRPQRGASGSCTTSAGRSCGGVPRGEVSGRQASPV